MELKLLFGFKEGVLVHVSSVNSGLKCNCYCPNCNSKLVARKGNIKVHHFAHYNNSNCFSGLETALHLVAKEIFRTAKNIKLPPYSSNVSDYGFHELTDNLNLKID